MSEVEERGRDGGGDTSNNNTGVLIRGGGGELAQRAAEGFEIWTVVNEGSVASWYTHTHTHSGRYTHQMGLRGINRRLLVLAEPRTDRADLSRELLFTATALS